MPHNMDMGSKEKNTPGNFSENDTKTIKDLANHPEVIAHKKHAEKTNP